MEQTATQQSVLQQVSKELIEAYGENETLYTKSVKGINKFTPEIIEKLMHGSHGTEGKLVATSIKLEHEKQKALHFENTSIHLNSQIQFNAFLQNKVSEENKQLKEKIKQYENI